MPSWLFSSIMDTSLDGGSFLLCTAVSLVLGAVIASAYLVRSRCTKSFVMTLALLPAMVQIIITLVNGNLGTGVAVMGAFSLVRFRSIPGTAREIGSLFLAMAVGLATGMGYLGIAAIVTVLLSLLWMLYSLLPLAERSQAEKELKITIPESLDYSGVFDDLFAEYTRKAELMRVKTTNLGSLYQVVLPN